MSGLIDIEKHYEEIIAYGKAIKAAGKKMASWGAGKKGTAFVARVDPKVELLSCIFDKNETKWGKVLPSGHKIVDFHRTMHGIDVVLLPMASFVAENTAVLLNNNFRGDIISVDDWLLGGVREPLQKRLKKPLLKRVKKSRIAALVVLYRPDDMVAEHIASYADNVDMLYVWDNSPEDNRQLITETTHGGKIYYIHNGENRGIGEPVNMVAELAKENDMEWLLTFDQDSVASKGMVEAMREYIESDILEAKAAIVAPMVNEPVEDIGDVCEEYLPYLSYVRSTITSGAMYRLDVLCQLRYRQEFFIDQLDNDFCVRAYLSDWKVVRLNHVCLHHQMDAGSFEVRKADGYRFYVGKYSPARYYYQYRNLLYSVRDFVYTAPDYAESCKVGLARLEAMARADTNSISNERAILCAKEDFQAGIMGKWRGLR